MMMPLANLETKFTLDGKTYEVEEYKLEVNQSIDFKGQPQQEVKGGQMIITLTEAADHNLYSWANKATLLKSGMVVMQTDLGKKVLEVEFENAYCTYLSRNISALNGTRTSLIIAPERIKMNGKPLENRWNR